MLQRSSRLKICLLLGATLCAAAGTPRSVRDGVYTKAQADRGRAVYREECAKCHAENLAGGEGAPAVVGEEFTAKWRGKSANDFFEITRTTMPADDPGHLSRRQYADLVAYILSANDYPSGDSDLESTADALASIRFETKSAEVKK